MPEFPSTLPEVLATLALERVNATFFVGTQLAAPANHILGGHIAAQALLAAAHTADERPAESMHVYFLRPGDARQPVDFEVVALQDGRTFSTRRVTARQFGTVLLDMTASFSVSTGTVVYQPALPAVPGPEALPAVPPHLAEQGAGEGNWSSLRWFQRRNVGTTDGGDPSRIWWRPNGTVPAEPNLGCALAAYFAAVSLIEPAMLAQRPDGGAVLSAQRDQSVWFHRPAELTDWLLFEASSPSCVDGRALSTGTMFNRTGELVCTATQEVYFPPR